MSWRPKAGFLAVPITLALASFSPAQGTDNAGNEQAQLARSERVGEIERGKAAFVNEILARFADRAAARGYDAYWQKGQRNLLTRSSSELLALSERSTDFETFDKLVFQGYIVNALGDPTQDLVFFPVAPCRLLDTRIAVFPYAGPLPPATEIAFSVDDLLGPQGGLAAGCGIPATDPPALSVVVTAVPTNTGQGNLRTYPTGGTIPTASVVNYQNAVVVASGTITQSCSGCTDELTVRNQGAGTTHVVVDVTGYFAPATFGAVNGTVRAAAHINGGAAPTVTRSFTLAGTPVTVTRAGVGIYVVSFGTNVQNRYYNVIPGNASSAVPAVSFADVTPALGDPNGLFIRLHDAAGAVVDTNFYVQVF